MRKTLFSISSLTPQMVSIAEQGIVTEHKYLVKKILGDTEAYQMPQYGHCISSSLEDEVSSKLEEGDIRIEYLTLRGHYFSVSFAK